MTNISHFVAAAASTDEATITPANPSRPRLRVFISYRLEPDACLAFALRRLIENSIEPQPIVFVASDEGGLRPSKVGFKKQLQDEAQKAQAVVAIISSASKDREWIFFEAGAAWGRGILYAPVLINANPGDLSSTIADYQAIRASDHAETKKLISSLAEINQSDVKSHYYTRYLTFQRQVDNYVKRIKSEGSPTRMGEAFFLIDEGEFEKAEKIFDDLERESTTPESKCAVLANKFSALYDPPKVYDSLMGLDDMLKNTSVFHFAVARECAAVHDKIEHYKKSIAINSGHTAISSKIKLAGLYYELGRKNEADKSMIDLIRERPAKDVKNKAAKLIAGHCSGSAFEKLIFSILSLGHVATYGYREAHDFLVENKWHNLSLACASMMNEIEEDGHSLNMIGISLGELNLNSLAYRSYLKASKLGTHVSACNIASLVKAAGVPAVALDFIRNQETDYDAQSKHYPYALQAELEEKIQLEENEEKTALKMGLMQLQSLQVIFESATYAPTPVREHVKSILAYLSAKFPVNLEFPGQTELKVWRCLCESALLPTISIFELDEKQVAFFCMQEDRIIGLLFKDFAKGDGLEWIEI
jgi:hypothetical protein